MCRFACDRWHGLQRRGRSCGRFGGRNPPSPYGGCVPAMLCRGAEIGRFNWGTKGALRSAGTRGNAARGEETRWLAAVGRNVT